MSAYPPQIVEFLGAEPTPDQWRAISWPLEPAVLVAGAGSGKTSVMAARVIYLGVYLIGVPYLRTLVFTASILGIAWIAAAALRFS